MGAVFAEPGQVGDGTGLGAAIGGSLGSLGKVAGAAGRKFRLTDISDEARELQKMMGEHIPLSQSAKPGLIRMIYNAFLSNLPGVGGRYRNRYKQSLDSLRHLAATKAHPEKGDIIIDPKSPVQDIFDQLGSYWKTAYDPMNKQLIGVFKNNTPKLKNDLVDFFEKNAMGRYKLLTPGTRSGKEVLDLKTFFNETLIPSAPNRAVKQELKKYVKDIDNVLEKNFPTNSKYRDIYDDYLDLREPYRNWIDLQAAAAKATSKEFRPAQLAKSAQRGTQGTLSKNQTVLQDVGELGTAALEDFPSKQGLFQTLAATAPVVAPVAGSVLGGPVGAGLALGGVIGVGKVMTTKGFERLISGQSQILKNQAKKLKAAGYTGRQIAVMLGLEEKQDATER